MSARTRTACVNCGRKKLRCHNGGDNTPCKRCVHRDLDCVYPPRRAPAPGRSQNKTACDVCRKDKLRCWPDEDQDGDRRCMYCREKGVECSYTASDEEQAHDESPEPVAGPSSYPGALTVGESCGVVSLFDHNWRRPIFYRWVLTGVSDRPTLTVDPTAGVDGPPSSASVSPVTRANSEGATSSTSVSPIRRTNSPSRGNWKEVCLAPSPKAETYEESLYEAYAAQD
ncbi:hypothetical protein V8D89_007295 [Ganoderma adspersum]